MCASLDLPRHLLVDFQGNRRAQVSYEGHSELCHSIQCDPRECDPRECKAPFPFAGRKPTEKVDPVLMRKPLDDVPLRLKGVKYQGEIALQTMIVAQRRAKPPHRIGPNWLEVPASWRPLQVFPGRPQSQRRFDSF